ncbi:MAG: valine--tRNA ligase, partial [Bacteroidales bacterium]|nr:valine--tRNA ligase [Bacteroidales bacterium]
FKEQNSKLYYLKYKIEGSEEFVSVATTRPETILGDTAICVHPEDERYSHLKGKNVIIPVIGRVIPVIFDEYVDREFGTGALKITPAHDVNDYALGLKYRLDSIDIFNDNGTLNEHGLQYSGMDRFDCRKQISKDIEEAGLMLKVEDYVNKVGCSERTDAVIEPKLSVQWFLKMQDISKEALRVVEEDEVKFHPAKFKNTYRHWMENVKDWCISRQLWWGQRIPAYYLPNKELVVAKTREEALKIAQEKFPNENYTINDLKQDEDVLDTWFSSWLWPISVFDGIRHPDNKEINYYYPTNDLITAPEILFFWVARMIIAGLEYREEIPFKNVYLTGIVRDKQGRKMSKSLGNSPDPIDLIEQYGADGVRVGMLMASPAGNDLLFDESYCEQGRNFSNKIWNALRLITGWEVEEIAQPEHSRIAIEWFNEKLNETLVELNDDFSKYRLSESLMRVYKLVWDDFCSWYLEIIKPAYQKPIDKATLEATIDIFENLMKVLHPYMPFLTEEIYHIIKEREDGDCIMNALQPSIKSSSSTIVKDFAFASEKIAAIRQVRNEKNIPQKIELELYIKSSSNDNLLFDGIITKLCNLSKLEYIQDKKEGALSFMVRTTEMFIPLGDTINKDEEIKKLSSDLDYYKGFKISVEKKLSNEKFVSGAPSQVVENEKKKLSDAEQKITSITEQLKSLE